MSAGLRVWLQVSAAMVLLLGLLAWGLSQWHLAGISSLVADRLMLLNDLRKDALQDYLHTAEAELRFWSINPEILAAQRDLAAIWELAESQPALAAGLREQYSVHDSASEGVAGELDTGGGGDVTGYGQVHQRLHPMARLFVATRGYYDFFLIGADGSVYYSVEKEADFTANLNAGPLRDSHLAQVARQAMQLAEGEVAISDMQPYGPSDDAPAIFMALALRDPAGQVLGAIAFQLPTANIIEIMNYTSGMGETGETYLVGNDLLMRSNSRFREESTILRQRVDTSTVARGLAGESGVGHIEDYRGVPVMSAYTSLEVGSTRWAMMAEIDREEVVALAAEDRPSISGALLFIYGLSLWSVWYWRGRQMPGEDSGLAGLNEDLAVVDGMDFSSSGAGGSMGLGD